MTTRTIAYPDLSSYIGGTWTRGSGTEEVTVLNPATGTELGAVPLGINDDFVAALDAADAAFGSWRRTSPTTRAEILRRAAAIMRARASELADLITVELGKPTREARVEVVTAAEHIEWAAEEGRRGYGRDIPARTPRTVQTVRREPLGPIAGFAPWNAPLITPARKIAYVLAAGCTLVLKPSEETPGCALALVRAFEEAGLPEGVLNAIFGKPESVSTYLLSDSRVKGVTFTGSTGVGRALASLAAPSMKRLILELGGNAPVIINADVDVKAVAESAVRATYRNAGQICTSPSRFLIHDSIHDDFVQAFTQSARTLVVGNGLDERTDMGPVANEQRVAAMAMLTEDARRRGIDIPLGGHRIGEAGSFWSPTLLAGVDDECLISNAEPFGPMASTRPFHSLDEAIAVANRLPVGLASYVWTNSLSDATRLLDEIEAGSVVVNRWQASLPETPFGGYDDSGVGTEGGIEGVSAFQRIKYTSFAA
ncbi:NAD-dependent succinate-semialdehyde dehydrogenase [Nocardia jinanensis]|uniref:NAD-dependent succinate-semialdehyde dehydrogenase n=1 Tax=Nocardia jinanensis TaxID=382504 RepID=A0A917RLH5_9NOCA|nr:NAD-dependent succinate-semialdehyde dehydrogenase [Nocardia jinanensis]GGL14030.1 NAD-dependent succinate-semialdehyde dehydrogenase [Nocardia jinanensis]